MFACSENVGFVRFRKDSRRLSHRVHAVSVNLLCLVVMHTVDTQISISTFLSELLLKLSDLLCFNTRSLRICKI